MSLGSGPFSRRQLAWGGLGIAGLLAGYAMFGPSDQRRVLAILREVLLSPRAVSGDTEERRRARVRSALSKHALPSVSLTLPELGELEGHAAILSLLEQASGITLDVSIEQSDVVIEGETCEATLLVAVTLSTLGERRRQVRTLSCKLLRQQKAEFRLAQISASAASREQPEARP
jgi:hypothetical protein